MTAALLRNELFHHLLATNPERTRSENARAGAVALAFHAGIAVLLLMLPTASKPGTSVRIDPMVLEHLTLPDYPRVPAQAGAQSGSVVGGRPALVAPTVMPDVLQPPTTSIRISNDPTPINIDPSALTGRTGIGNEGTRVGSGGAGTTGDFIIVQNAPRMLNASHIAGLLRREYPPILLQSGIGGTVILHVLIGLDGSVIDARVWESSGMDALDRAALRVSRDMQFSPAQNRDQTVRVWAAIPVVFSARD